MVEVTPSIQIDASEIELVFVRAEGPGGQNVNKVATAVQLRFDIRNSPSLPDDVKARLVKLAGKRVTRDGILVLEARRRRTQEQNRNEAIDRFRKFLQNALEKPRTRKITRPTDASKEDRLRRKKRRATIKQMRGNRLLDQE